MSQREPSGPDLDGVIADANAVGLRYVVIGGGLSPLDYESVVVDAMEVELGGQVAPIANLRSFVGFKRLAGRPLEKRDLEELEALHGELPIDPIPGLDT